MSHRIDGSCLYAESHEWIRLEDEIATVGISDFAQDELSDVVYADLPEEGDSFKAGESFCVLESVKAASDVYMPVAATVIEVNEALEEEPELVNADCFGKGWLVKVKVTKEDQLKELMDASDYADHLANQ